MTQRSPLECSSVLVGAGSVPVPNPLGPLGYRGSVPPRHPMTRLSRSPLPPPTPPQVAEVQDAVQESLRRVQQGEAEALPERDRTELKRRKLLLEV